MAEIIKFYPRLAVAKGVDEQIYLHLAIQHILDLDTSTFRSVKVSYLPSQWPDIPDLYQVYVQFEPKGGADCALATHRLISTHFEAEPAQRGGDLFARHFGVLLSDLTDTVLGGAA